MLFGVQIIGILFSLVMIYFTFLYYKRNNYDTRFLFVWILVWLAFLVLVTWPKTIYGVMEFLEIKNTADFFVIIGFLFFAVAIFYMFTVTKKLENKMDILVRELAIKGVKRKKRGKK